MESRVPPLQGGWILGIANLALKRQAIQISPLWGEGGDKPLPYEWVLIGPLSAGCSSERDSRSLAGGKRPYATKAMGDQ
jgi:hypothetical protein